MGQWAGWFGGVVPDCAQGVDDWKVFRFRDLGALHPPAACGLFDTGFVKERTKSGRISAGANLGFGDQKMVDGSPETASSCGLVAIGLGC